MKKIIVSVSGGKDSTATLIKAKEYDKNVMGVFCDTGWEHPQTYEYIDYLREKLQVEIKTLRNEKFNSVIDLIKHKKIFPSPMRRFCSEYLKLKPMINFLIELSSNPNIEIENWIGIRSNESRSRNERYGHLSSNDILSYNNMYSLTKKQAAALKNVKLRFPVVNLTANDVYKIIISAGLDVNKLYYQGQNRVGCYPCILSSIGSYKSVWQDKIGKERILYLRELENELNKNNEFKTTLKPGLSAQELVRRFKNNDLQIEMFEPEYVCSFCNI